MNDFICFVKGKQMDYRILDQADGVIRSKIEKDEIKGASLCVIHRGDTVYFRQFGMADAERQIPMTEDSIFRCYSMTKPITSAAVMAAVEKGMISLSDLRKSPRSSVK